MPRSHIKREPPTAMRLPFYSEELRLVTEFAKRNGLDFAQALRVIIHQHAAWEPYVRPVHVPEGNEDDELRQQMRDLAAAAEHLVP